MLWVIIGLSWAAMFLVGLIFALSLCRVSSHADRETERLREAEVTPDLRRSAADPWSSASRRSAPEEVTGERMNAGESPLRPASPETGSPTWEVGRSGG